MQAKKPGFHTIDALRFFAFLKVFLLHIPVDRDFPIFSFLKKGGGIGVVFFFVLSGFLITHNLVAERAASDRIDLRRFYLKRILRIWPLFYLLLLIVYLTPWDVKQSLGWTNPGYTPDWRFSFAFLENYKIILCHGFPSVGILLITWSLCIEEHFYIIWGLLAAFTKARRMVSALGILITIAIATRILCGIYLPQYDIASTEILTSLDYFAIGGLLGYFYALHADRVDRLILSIPLWLRWSYVMATIVFVFTNFLVVQWLHLPAWLTPTFTSIIFAIMIAIVLPQSSPIRINNGHWLSYLGRISYGLYLFHPAVMAIIYKCYSNNGLKIDTWGMLALTIIYMLGATIVLAALLYRSYEKPILNLRKYL